MTELPSSIDIKGLTLTLRTVDTADEFAPLASTVVKANYEFMTPKLMGLSGEFTGHFEVTGFGPTPEAARKMCADQLRQWMENFA